MTGGAACLPDGFRVRLHDDVEVGAFVTSGIRILRISPAARQLLGERTLEVSSPVTAKLAGRLLDLDLADPVLVVPPVERLDELTVVIPVRDRAGGVARLLGNLAAEVRCVVVDDASRDPRALADAVGPHGAELVRLDRNLGPAGARNIGLGQVRTPYVAFIDADVDASVGALRGLVAHLRDPGAALVAPRVRSRGGRGWLDRYEDASGSLDLGPRAATVRKWSSVAYVPSACLVARVADLGAGFDVALRSGEDVDLVWRLQDEGRRTRYAAEIVVEHDTRGSVGPWLMRKAFYGTSAAQLARRHGDRVAPAVLTPAAAGFVAALLAQRRWSPSVAGFCLLAGARHLSDLPRDLPPAARLTVLRAGGAGVARQSTHLVLRHWSPVALLCCFFSARARRVVLALAVADGVLAHRRAETELDAVRFVLARRAEQLAYGTGVWSGALRAGSVRCLLPHWVRPGTRP